MKTFILLAVILTLASVTARADASDEVYNGSTPYDLQRAEKEHMLTREHSDTIMWQLIAVIGGVVALIALFINQAIQKKVEDETNEIKTTLAQFIDPNNNTLRRIVEWRELRNINQTTSGGEIPIRPTPAQ